MADTNGRRPGDPGYDPSTDVNNTPNGDGTYTDQQGNVMDSGGGLIQAAPSFTAPAYTGVGSSIDPGLNPSSGTLQNYTDPTTGYPVGTQATPTVAQLGPVAPGPAQNGQPGQPGAPGTPGAPGVPAPDAAGNLGAQIQAMLNALASGNQAAAKEAAREFDATFGLDQQKFQQSISQYNQDFGLKAAATTGVYNGQPTMQAQAQQFQEAVTAAGLTGYYNAPGAATAPASTATGTGLPAAYQDLLQRNPSLANPAYQQVLKASRGWVFDPNEAPGAAQTAAAGWNAQTNTFDPSKVAFAAPTSAAPTATPPSTPVGATGGATPQGVPTLALQNQQFQQALSRAQFGLNAAEAAGRLQNDPFQQAQVLYGVSGLMQGITGGNLPSFQAPTGTAQNTGARGAANQAGGWAYNPANFSPPGAGGATGSTDPYGGLGNLTSPNQVVARSYIKAPTATQNMITSALANSTGLDQATIDSQIKAQLPNFTAPSFGLASV